MIIKTCQIGKRHQKIPYKVVNNQHALLMPIGDIHFGVPDFPTQKFKTTIKWALDRGALFIGMGEYLDFTSASQRSIMSGLRESTRDQIDDGVRERADELLEILKPTAGRWIGLLEGDHRWEFLRTGTTIDQYICEKLECDFLGTSAWIKIFPSELPAGHPEGATTIFAHHGIGGSRKAGGHLNRVEDLLGWIEADLYLMGHSHAKIFAPVDYMILTPDGIHTHRTRIIARTGAWLKGYSSSPSRKLDEPAILSRGTYVEKAAFAPTSLGAPCFGIGFEQIEHSKYYKPALHGSL